ncbi:hypothetical protein EMCRGX_G033065 [Ephydatia muelleri]
MLRAIWKLAMVPCASKHANTQVLWTEFVTGATAAAAAAELRKHSVNDAKCSELGWACIPLAAESDGSMGHRSSRGFLAPGVLPGHEEPPTKVQDGFQFCMAASTCPSSCLALLMHEAPLEAE